MLEKQLKETHKIPSYLLIKDHHEHCKKNLLLKIKHRVFAEAEWWKGAKRGTAQVSSPHVWYQVVAQFPPQVGAWKGCP